MTSQDRQVKSQKFDVRWKTEDLDLIRAAAKIQHIDPSTFIRQQAVAGAEAVVLDQQRFPLNAEQWKAVHKAFDAPAKLLPNVAKLMAEPDEWDDEE
jgi:uncharacterized protein (DUF1778 family)